MRCFKDYKNDRTCEICEIVNNDTFEVCKKAYNRRKEIYKELRNKKDNCKHKTECWDEYTPFDGCNLNGKGNGRHADDCNPLRVCMKYLKEELDQLK